MEHKTLTNDLVFYTFIYNNNNIVIIIMDKSIYLFIIDNDISQTIFIISIFIYINYLGYI